MSILSTQSFSKLEELNRDACLYIEEQRYEEAAQCLDEAERILQYAANCGKTIQRTLITTILNNQACLLQKNSLLQQSSNYLQAIINNINDFIENCPQVKINQNTINQSTEQFIKFVTGIERKNVLALYHLRFCALVSHSQNHVLALKSAKKAVELLKQICQEQYDFEMYRQIRQQEQYKKNEDEVYKHISSKSIYKQLSNIKQVDSRTDAFDMYLPKLIQCIQKYQKRIEQYKEVGHNISDIFKSYSIGNLMEAAPLPLQSKFNYSQFIMNQLSIVGKLYRIIHISMAYFTVATELRLVAADKYALNEDERTESLEFQQSKVHHQISIMLIVKYFPCKSVFFDHAVCSFQNHYGFNLLQISQMHTEVGSVSVSIIHDSEDSKRKQKVATNDRNQNPHQMQYNQTNNIPDQELLEEVEFEAIKNTQTLAISKVTDINGKEKIQFKKLKHIKPKDKIEKIQRISSSKVVQVNKIGIAPHSKNKENTSKNRLFSKSKNSIKSRSKDMKLMTKNSQKQQKRGIYYETTNKNRSKSKKCNVTEKSTSKRRLLSNKHGSGCLNNKAKQTRISQEYGIHSALGFCANTVYDSQTKKLHNKQQQNSGSIKFNKVTGKEHAGLKKLKSPRDIKRQSSHRQKSKSKDQRS